MPAGVHGSGPGAPMHEAAQVDRVQAVDVLVRVDREQGPLLVEAVRQRHLDQERVDGRVGVEPVDRLLDVGLGRRRPAGARGTRRCPTSAQSCVLHGHVPGARHVVADEDGAEPDRHALARPAWPSARPPRPAPGPPPLRRRG